MRDWAIFSARVIFSSASACWAEQVAFREVLRVFLGVSVDGGSLGFVGNVTLLPRAEARVLAAGVSVAEAAPSGAIRAEVEGLGSVAEEDVAVDDVVEANVVVEEVAACDAEAVVAAVAAAGAAAASAPPVGAMLTEVQPVSLRSWSAKYVDRAREYKDLRCWNDLSSATVGFILLSISLSFFLQQKQ